ncbi:40S ribosomal protein S25-3 [Cyclospora cayetanensis]|uniref:40S ribosomal protein S25 n=1 Tax=Cyclospora cayetanensis TaxID=88456 RepID=A0A6P6RQF5_9EIME|nr:40S ribosomal protein S25-3 [Cyclospora cayetanensis]
MAPKEKKTKEQIAAAAAAGSRKNKKHALIFHDRRDVWVVKLCSLAADDFRGLPLLCLLSALQKWSKGKSKEKLNYAVMFDQATVDKLLAEVPKMKLITPFTICERLRINASLARRGIRELHSQGLIKPLGEQHHSHYIYTRPTAA